ncbi:NADH-quinone oxidoreductase subunit L [Candidatus Tachikawaea gelatinosa]|uniref:NADH-quinone oxidoreductase subunit L n=1 Tax=Candidatus Tachikawaea gelatinosa TaxID=1410383 RepID=A0A090AIT8_9ENTR|nr:NADH-quinone oxidoreductase subunit L [Candidatus Tachikawaea gelatinosa]
MTILIPLIGFCLLAFSLGSWSKKICTLIGVGSIALSALVAVYVAFDFSRKNTIVFNQFLWDWIKLDNFNIKISFMIDSISLTMLSMITGVGLLIHIFASWYMYNKEGYSRFFAYTNLFMASMLILILADNLMLMYLGWELVGVCSYLLIGFYYQNLNNCYAAMKAFIITRIGDIFLAIGLFIFYREFATLNFQEIKSLVPLQFLVGSSILTVATLMLLIGSIGKSAQFPMQNWLPDAMAGPTPVSALIHAATMVTAGVYLITRTYFVFLITPTTLLIIQIVGVITLLLGGISALFQTNIKRILAYSTISQIGYMFLALGVEAWDAAMYHLLTHAFFKALLFLSAGSIVNTCNHEQNIFKMGGLKNKIPLVYFCFLIGGFSLSGLPLITASFYSKDEILLGVFTHGHLKLMIAGLIGTILSSLYIFRTIFVVFHGKLNKKNIYSDVVNNTINHNLPLVILTILSTYLGTFVIPSFSKFFSIIEKNNVEQKFLIQFLSSVCSLSGFLIAIFFWLIKKDFLKKIKEKRFFLMLNSYLYNGFGFDYLYNKIFVQSYLRFSNFLRNDPFIVFFDFLTICFKKTSNVLLKSINGMLRWYIASIGLGASFTIFLILFLKQSKIVL